jgi:hypothetical protein
LVSITDKVPDNLWWTFGLTEPYTKKDAKREKEMRNHIVLIWYQETSAGVYNRVK